MQLVLILDSKIDKNLMDEKNSNSNLINQIKNQGCSVEPTLKQNLIIKYGCSNSTEIIKFQNFILIKEAQRQRVFLVE